MSRCRCMPEAFLVLSSLPAHTACDARHARPFPDSAGSCPALSPATRPLLFAYHFALPHSTCSTSLRLQSPGLHRLAAEHTYPIRCISPAQQGLAAISSYTQVTFFAPKDALLSGNPAKLIKGADFDPELAAISTAIASKFDGTNFLAHAPTALSGLAAVTGTATTWMASDSAPAINQAIAPTWTGIHTFSTSGSGGVYLQDLTAPANNRNTLLNPSDTGGFGIFAANDAQNAFKGVFSATYAAGAVSAISLGNATDKPAITLFGPTNIPAPTAGPALTVIGIQGTFAQSSIEVLANGVSSAFMAFKDGQAGARRYAIGSGLGAPGQFAIYDDGASLYKFAVTGGASGALQGFGPVAAALVDMTPDTGTFTGTFTGMTTVVTGTCTWTRSGKLVTLYIPAGSGVSNASTYTMTGVPAAIQPATLTQTIGLPPGIVFDNSTFVLSASKAATVQVNAVSGTLSFFISSGSWTSSGTKGLNTPITISYLLN